MENFFIWKHIYLIVYNLILYDKNNNVINDMAIKLIIFI